jgi:outer membrane protein TolC
MKRAERGIVAGSLLLGMLAVHSGCSSPRWARQLWARHPDMRHLAKTPEPQNDSQIADAIKPWRAAPDTSTEPIAGPRRSLGPLTGWRLPSMAGQSLDESAPATAPSERIWSPGTILTAAVGDQAGGTFELVDPLDPRSEVSRDPKPSTNVAAPTDGMSWQPTDGPISWPVDDDTHPNEIPGPNQIYVIKSSGPTEQPISLASALAATSGQNPQVNFARQRINEAFANLEAAEVFWLPSIRAGGNYNKHEGRIQDVAGEIIETSRGSVYTGLGAQAVGAGSPAVPGLLVDFHVRDALFQPQIATQTLGARRQESRAVTNDLMLETAIAYIDLLEAMQIQAVAQQILAESESLAETTMAFAQAGQGLQADADRSRAEVSFRQIDVRRADEATRLASVRLARLLRADQTATLVPIEPVLLPIEMVNIDQPLPQLISTGLVNRPELAEARFLVNEAVQRYKRERYAPLVPSVLLGMSYGGNGGGLGGNIDNFGDRMDFDVAAFWEVRNLGWGERAARGAANSRVEQARWRQLQQMDQVAADVAQAQAEISARRDQLALAQAAISAAEDSYRRNSERIRDGQGLPIEVLQSIQSLDEARRRYTMIIADYNRSQFRLQRALGWPVDGLDTACRLSDDASWSGPLSPTSDAPRQ